MQFTIPANFVSFAPDNLSWVLDIYMDAKAEYNEAVKEEDQSLEGFMQWTYDHILTSEAITTRSAMEIVFNFAFILTSPDFVELTPEEVAAMEQEIELYGEADETTMPGK